jgi:hypothetical protein
MESQQTHDNKYGLMFLGVYLNTMLGAIVRLEKIIPHTLPIPYAIEKFTLARYKILF